MLRNGEIIPSEPVMKCDEARKLIDERIHEITCGEGGKKRDWSDLEGHLSGCQDCSKLWRELLTTGELLTCVEKEQPTSLEIENMLNAITATSATPRPDSIGLTGLLRYRSLAAASVGVAAVLMVAFFLGNSRYGLGTSVDTIFTEVNHALSTPSGGEFGGVGSLIETDVARLQSLGYADMETRSKPRSVSRKYRGRKQLPSTIGEAVAKLNRRVNYDQPTISSDFTPLDAPETPYVGGAFASAVGDDGIERFEETDTVFLGFPLAQAAANVRLGEVWDRGGSLDGRRSGRDNATVQTQKNPLSTPPNSIDNAKIIKTGQITIEVDEYQSSYERVEAAVSSFNASVADVTTTERSGGAMQSRIVIRVSPQHFESLFAALKDLGRVELEKVKADDVSAEYVDVDSRIGSLRIALARLEDLMQNKSIIHKMASLLEVEREMTRVRSELEGYLGRMRVMEDRIAMSTITVILQEPVRMLPGASLSVEVETLTKSADDLGDVLKRLGGRLSSGDTSKRSDGTLMGNYEIQLPVVSFSVLLAEIEGLGRVEQKNITDHSFEYADAGWAKRVPCRVHLILYERSRPLPSGSIRFEVEDLTQALTALKNQLAAVEGFVTSNNTSRNTDGSSMATVSAKVPAGRFAELLENMTGLGRTTQRNISGEVGIIVGGAAHVLRDLVLTLAERPRQVPRGQMVVEVASFETARQELSDLINNENVFVNNSWSNQRTDGSWTGQFELEVESGRMEKVVTMLSSLGRVSTRQMSGLGLGDLSKSDPKAMGQLHVTLAEKIALSPGPDRTAGALRRRLNDALGGLYDSFGLIIYGLIVMAPWLLIVVLLAWVMSRVLRRRQQRRGVSISE